MRLLTILFALALILLTSCSLQKRRYMDGYYFSSRTKHKIESNTEKDTSKISIEPIAKINITAIPKKIETKNNLQLVAAKTNQAVYPVHKKTEECDVIILKSGDEVKGKVIEITLTEIKYKKCDNPNGPTISINKKDVFIIKYSNGTKDIINSVSSNKSEQENNQPKKVNIVSVIGFIISLIAAPVFLYLSVAFGIFFFLAALVLSILGLIQIAQHPNEYVGKGFAIAGIIITLLSILGSVAILFLI